MFVERGRVFVEGRAAPERYIQSDAHCRVCDLPVPVIVPAGQLYVLGDNRGAASSDSRDWGPIRREWVVGRVIGDF